MAHQGFKVFDSDMHIMEPPDLWERYLSPALRSQAPRGTSFDSVFDLGLVFPASIGPGKQTAGPPRRGRNYEHYSAVYAEDARRGWTSEVQLEAMDAEGLDLAVLFPSRGLGVLTNPNLNPPLAAALARAYNDWLYDFCQADTERLLGAGMLSVFDIDDAITEANRVVKELGFKAVFLRANIVNGKNWHDAFYEPLWDALEQLDVPLGFHEATGSRSRQTGDQFDPNFGLRRIFCQPMTQMEALGSFAAGGVLAWHPKLKVAFLEANCSWLPWLLWRMDEVYELEGDVSMPDLTMAPSAYFKRQCWVSIEPEEVPAVSVIEQLGSDHVVFSTDYPHSDSRYPESVDEFLGLPLSAEAKRKILWDNCAEFYAAGVPELAAH